MKSGARAAAGAKPAGAKSKDGRKLGKGIRPTAKGTLGPEAMRIASIVLETGYVCDRCLGRQFAKLGIGRTNPERGRRIRKLLSETPDVQSGQVKCVLCEGLFDAMPEMAAKPVKDLKKMEFRMFALGVRMTDLLVMTEESLWEKTGLKYCEPIKAEISRELASIISKATSAKPDQNRPDVVITFDVGRGIFEIFSNPVFVYGKYKKFSRGLPQTSSPAYGQAVEDIISRPLMKATLGKSHVLHAQGREDKEARCLAWRPFVLEIKQPKRRRPDLRRIKEEINRGAKVKVSGLRFSGRKEVAEIKSKNPFKTYRMIVDFDAPVENPDALGTLAGAVRQRTPWRLLGQKPDKAKHKKVKSIQWKRINTERYQIVITAESGLYLHEFVTGDGGRTDPSVSKVLGSQARIREFDLVGLED